MSNQIEEEDFLEVDTPINGQKYVLLSFVSPNKVLKRKELFTFHKYLKHNDENYSLTYEKFVEKWNNFVYVNRENIDSEFSEMVDFQTSVRGMKVRGVYETYREAKVKAARLQKVDRSFHVFIGQVGYWLPWDPEPDNIEDQEYLNRELNTLVHEYKKNQEYRDEVFADRVRTSKEQAEREVSEHMQRQVDENVQQASQNSNPQGVNNATNNSSGTYEIGGPGEGETKVTSTNETLTSLEGDDPWLSRTRSNPSEVTSEVTSENTPPTVLEI